MKLTEERLHELAKGDMDIWYSESQSMAKELLALRKAFSEPVAFQNNYTGKLWRPEQQPGADQDTDVYTPLYRKPTDSTT